MSVARRLLVPLTAALLVCGFLIAASFTSTVRVVEVGKPVVSYDLREDSTPRWPLCRPFNPA